MKNNILKNCIFIFTLIFIFFSTQLLYSQKFVEKKKGKYEIPNLSNEQMLEDFDYLVHVINKICIQYNVRKKVTNQDISDELKILRDSIQKINSTIEYVGIIKSVLNLTQDVHAKILPDNYYSKSEFRKLKDSVTIESLVLTSKYWELYKNRNKEKNYALTFRFKYLNGEYYNLLDFEYDSIFVPAGAKIIKYNSKNIHSVVNNLKANKFALHWDFNNNRYYHDLFWTVLDKNKDITLTFETKDSTYNVEFDFLKKPDYQNLSKKNSYLIKYNAIKMWDDGKVEYFKNKKILYIRVPEMDYYKKDYYPKQIRKIGYDKDIKGVVIDIRDNGGGSDYVWINILKSLIKDTLKPKVTMIAKNNNCTLQYLNKLGVEYTDNIAYNDLVCDSIIFVFEHEKKIPPKKNSLKLNCPIIILTNSDIFSSSGSFISYAQQFNNITTIGERSGILGGQGIHPFVFTLPNSKILFTIMAVYELNFSNDNPFHDKIDIETKVSIENYIKYYNSNLEKFSKLNLIENDPYFINCLEVID